LNSWKFALKTQLKIKKYSLDVTMSKDNRLQRSEVQTENTRANC